MRKTLIITHRWVAIVVGMGVLCAAGSGTAMVFEGAIDRGLNPQLWRVQPSGEPLPIDSLVARVQAKFRAANVAAVGLSPAVDRAWTLNAGPLTVFVNPYTGEVLGTRTPQEAQAAFARRLHVFHVEVFGGRIGRSIVAIATAVALFLVITGVSLWWPDKLVRINTNASWKRITFDLHHALGVVAAIVLLVITTSGLVIHYDALGAMVRSLNSAPATPPPAQPAGPANAPRLSFDAIAAAARGALPGANIMFISSGGPQNPVVVAMRFPEDHTPGGRSRIFVDRYAGTVLGVTSTRAAQLGTRLDNLKRSLHTGDVLGKPSEVLWLLATLVLMSQVVTGLLMWWNARRSR